MNVILYEYNNYYYKWMSVGRSIVSLSSSEGEVTYTHAPSDGLVAKIS